MKKIFALLLSLAMIFSLAVSVNAAEPETISEAAISAELLTRGYPQIVLDTMDYSTKVDLYDEDVGFMGAVITYYDEETASFVDVDITETGRGCTKE